MRLVQELKPIDRQRRIEYAINMLDILNHRPELLSFILFSDEAHFEIHGQVNRHNFRYWDTECPNDFYRDAPLHSPRLTVWAGISKAGIVGPFFTRQTINGERYLDMLRDQVRVL
jgi:hypothetical protein